MRAVYIRIGHDNDLMITELGDIEIVMDSGTERSDHGFNLGVGIDFIQSCLLYV